MKWIKFIYTYTALGKLYLIFFHQANKFSNLIILKISKWKRESQKKNDKLFPNLKQWKKNSKKQIEIEILQENVNKNVCKKIY